MGYVLPIDSLFSLLASFCKQSETGNFGNKGHVIETLNFGKSWDSERASYNNRDCAKHITAKKTRLRDPLDSTKLLRDAV